LEIETLALEIESMKNYEKKDRMKMNKLENELSLALRRLTILQKSRGSTDRKVGPNPME
jgi:hypothetical protein